MKIRYIRDWQNGKTVNGQVGTNCDWREMKAIDYDGNNIALNKKPVPSHPMKKLPTYATDEDLNTIYWTDASPNVRKNITLDLGGIYDVDKIIIARASSPAICKETKLEVSTDGIIWATIFDSAVSGTYQEPQNGREFQLEDSRLTAPSQDSSLNETITFFEKFLSECNIDKDNLKNILTLKNVEVLPNDKMSTLIGKVGDIVTGKRWASGSATSKQISAYNSSYVEFNLDSLEFLPSTILLFAENYPNTSYCEMLTVCKDLNIMFNDKSTYCRFHKTTTGNFFTGLYEIKKSGNIIYIYSGSVGVSYEWVAFE